MKIHLLRADVESLQVDAIATAMETHDGGAGGRVVVSGGNLLARFVIQVAVPNIRESDADEKLHASAVAAIRRAEELAVATVGLPVLGSGEGGFSVERSARALLTAAIEHQSRARSLQVVIFCLFGEEDHRVFERILRELQA